MWDGGQNKARSITVEGERDTLQRGEREIVQTGEEENRRAREGEEQKKHFGEAIVSTALPEGQPPAGDRAKRSQSRSCIPLRSSET